ncbi:MAG: hypothetical protein IT318_04035, partial [Anaerolineales bacterium]|nr:hypothetical protein [Anaerolineales bacterium]
QHPDWPRAYAALRKLAVCQGSFTFAAARALIGEPRPLSLLKDWGLVTLENLRYTIDPLLSVHVELDDSAGLTHFSYFLAFAEDADSRQDYQGMEAEFPNLVTAFDWALANNELESALNLANACSSFMSNRGMLEQRRNWYERIAAKLPTTADETPQDYLQASVQIGLGVSYYESLRGDRKVNLVRAVNAFGRALRFFNPQRYPSEYALIQNNLGTTFRMLAEVEEPTKNLNLAISAFERAGRFFTREESPLDFGVIQNNLGATYLNLAGLENRKDNLRRAISAFRRALVYIKPENQPLHYALIHNNLGIAYADMAEVESQDRRTENIKKAISAFDRAGRFLTPQRAPMHHARLFTNLGHTHRNLAEIYGEPDKLRTAIAAYTRALSIWTAARAPMLHAQLQSSMGFACLDLSAMEDEQSNLRKAEDAFKQAIAVYSPRLNQSDRIRLTVLLGIVYRRLGQIRESIACWREAENYFRQINQTDMADRMARYISGESDPPVPPNPAKWVAWQ